MKGKIQLLFILSVLTFQNISCNSQSSSSNINSFQNVNVDSLVKEAENAAQNYFKEHELHKDNKDSAWINDFDGNIIWDSRAKSKDGKTINILDSITNNYYILDSTHTIITAYNKSKQVIWKTDPHKDNSLPEYRHKNPTIKYFKIGKLRKNVNEIYNKDTRVIFISFDNSQFGFLDLKTGKFHFSGQD